MSHGKKITEVETILRKGEENDCIVNNSIMYKLVKEKGPLKDTLLYSWF